MRYLLTVLLFFAGMACAVAEPAVVTTDVPYGDLPRQKLDLYLPAGQTGDAPVLVFFYGGSWQGGAKGDLRETAMSLAAAGMIVAVPDYRLYPQAVFPQFVEDCAAAVAHVRWMLSQLGGRHPLFIGGHSAGAFNAAMLAADKHFLADAGVPADAVAGYVLLSGPYEMGGPNMISPYREIFPAGTGVRANVADFIDGKEPPLLLMGVEADTVANPLDSIHLAGAVMKHGGRVVVATYKGSDHGATFRGLSHPDSAVRKDLAAFITVTSSQ